MFFFWKVEKSENIKSGGHWVELLSLFRFRTSDLPVPFFVSQDMSRSPCAASLKNFLPTTDFKSPHNHLRLSPVPPVQASKYRANLSPYDQCNSSQSSQLLPSPSRFSITSPNNLFHQRDSFSHSVDSPHRLLFVSKIKTTLTSSNLLGRGRFGQVVLAKYKGKTHT